MRVTAHPPLYLDRRRVGDRERPRYRPVRHARAWIVHELVDWGVSLQAHLHLIDEGEWHRVDLARLPVSLVPPGGAAEDPPDGVDATAWADEVLAALRREGLPASRLPGTGTVSALGEDPARFRRRISGGLRPVLDRLPTPEPTAARRGRWFGRSRRSTAEGNAGPAEMSEAVARLLAEIESVRVELGRESVRSLEAGWLMVPEGMRLPEPSDGSSSGAVGGNRIG